MQKVVLLIDDNQEELLTLTGALQQAGIDSLGKWVNTAEGAFYYLKQVVPDYIFFDVKSPAIHNLDFLQEVKKMNKVEQVPLILYSTDLTKETYEKAIEAGASYYIQKTASQNELVKKLETIFTDAIV